MLWKVVLWLVVTGGFAQALRLDPLERIPTEGSPEHFPKTKSRLDWQVLVLNNQDRLIPFGSW